MAIKNLKALWAAAAAAVTLFAHGGTFAAEVETPAAGAPSASAIDTTPLSYELGDKLTVSGALKKLGAYEPRLNIYKDEIGDVKAHKGYAVNGGINLDLGLDLHGWNLNLSASASNSSISTFDGKALRASTTKFLYNPSTSGEFSALLPVSTGMASLVQNFADNATLLPVLGNNTVVAGINDRVETPIGTLGYTAVAGGTDRPADIGFGFKGGALASAGATLHINTGINGADASATAQVLKISSRYSQYRISGDLGYSTGAWNFSANAGAAAVRGEQPRNVTFATLGAGYSFGNVFGGQLKFEAGGFINRSSGHEKPWNVAITPNYLVQFAQAHQDKINEIGQAVANDDTVLQAGKGYENALTQYASAHPELLSRNVTGADIVAASQNPAIVAAATNLGTATTNSLKNNGDAQNLVSQLAKNLLPPQQLYNAPYYTNQSQKGLFAGGSYERNGIRFFAGGTVARESYSYAGTNFDLVAPPGSASFDGTTINTPGNPVPKTVSYGGGTYTYNGRTYTVPSGTYTIPDNVRDQLNNAIGSKQIKIDGGTYSYQGGSYRIGTAPARPAKGAAGRIVLGLEWKF